MNSVRQQILASILPVVFACSGCASQANSKLVSFSYNVSAQHRNSYVNYALNPEQEKFYVWLPANYSRNETYGLIVYTSAADGCEIPAGWDEVLTRRKFLFIAPQNGGNNTPGPRRTGLGVLAALEMMHDYRIDPRRVYAAGLSGGARNASILAFKQPDIFKGTIQDCGSDYYRKVAVKDTTIAVDTLGKPYGVVENSSQEEASAARDNVKFVLITGSGDFRRGNILDIYNNGYKQDGFRAKLIDVSGMGHQDCSAATLEAALDFLK